MLKKQISGLRWEYHLETYIGTLTPGSGYAGNQLLSAERVSIPECLIHTWLIGMLNSSKLRLERKKCWSGQMFLHIATVYPVVIIYSKQYVYSFRKKLKSSDNNTNLELCFLNHTLDTGINVPLMPSCFGSDHHCQQWPKPLWALSRILFTCQKCGEAL